MSYDAKRLLETVLADQTESVREWATTPHNAPIWLQICEASIRNHPDRAFDDAVLRMGTFMVATCYGM